ncbi:DUF1015 family protein [Actinocatenispora sera]|uniref:DUF1015 domain-containing protein n=1 Tax=Actinocatenispora sera TaxID=390989 RepID=A0A810L107_9ACTN|nr:DUF1015 family protein [Actinocatenispora sera]BCJ29093.1 hypothetical protein Asera_32010 [Actinocatenispora sera]
MQSPAHPIGRAWISAGGTGAQNYDEFADDGEITEIVRANPASALAIEMPHRTPEAVAAGLSFTDSLPAAAARFAALCEQSRYRAAEQVVGLYRIAEPAGSAGRGAGDGAVSYGVFCLVDTDQISASADEPGLVIRNEDVFVAKVKERVALADAIGHLLSPILLLQTGSGEALQALLVELTGRLGAPDVTDTDPQGRSHQLWALGPGADQDRVLAAAGGGELIVADGNHRSLAAQVGGLPRFLAVVTTPESVHIQPYHRLIRDVPQAAELPDRLRAAGATVEPLPAPAEVPPPGTVHLHTAAGSYAVRLPVPSGAGVVDRLDYSAVEAVLVRDVLELDPSDKRISYVGGDYPASWLRGEVDAGRADLAVLIAPVSVADFVAVNLARAKMPRKSTWFTPKARAGLLAAELSTP